MKSTAIKGNVEQAKSAVIRTILDAIDYSQCGCFTRIKAAFFNQPEHKSIYGYDFNSFQVAQSTTTLIYGASLYNMFLASKQRAPCIHAVRQSLCKTLCILFRQRNFTTWAPPRHIVGYQLGINQINAQLGELKKKKERKKKKKKSREWIALSLRLLEARSLASFSSQQLYNTLTVELHLDVKEGMM